LSAAITATAASLAVDRTGDLDAAVEQVLGERRHRPFAVADGAGLGREIRLLAGIEAPLPRGAIGEETLPFRAEGAFEPGDEIERLRGENPVVAVADRSGDLDAARQRDHFHGVGGGTGHGAGIGMVLKSAALAISRYSMSGE
jgi:hypothetical protein